MLLLETERLKLEELHTIEDAISSRIKKNPFLIDKKSQILNAQNKTRLSHKQILIKQSEIAEFLKIYETQKKDVAQLLGDEETFDLIANELDDPEANLEKFDQLYTKILENNVDDEDHHLIYNPLVDQYKRIKGKLVSSKTENLLRFNELFTTDESFGNYLDLFEIYELWLNLKEVEEKLNYVKYLEIFDEFDKQGLNHNSRPTHDYLVRLHSYIVSFIKKSKPLFNLDSFLSQLEYDASDDFYCDRCDKNFSKSTVFEAHKQSPKHLNRKITTPLKKSPKFLEFQIHQLVSNVLSQEKLNTKLNTERKKALTERERLIEIDQLTKLENEDEYYTSTNDDDQDQQNEEENDDDPNFFNPMNLPLGIDGQPIPFWLWKLHGLGKDYSCEICGNYVYKGRKAFDIHFGEIRHLHGLKCLGIDYNNNNLKIFKDIVKIDEVLKIWEISKKKNKSLENLKNNSVEVEDEEGNVMSEQVYNDLKKQGLI